MPPGFGKKKIKTRKYVGELRKSKIISTAGCGAMVEFPGFSGIMGGMNLWNQNFTDDMKIHEKSLEDYLHKDYFIQPSASGRDTDFQKEFQIPAIRFPEYYYCPECHELDHYRKLSKIKNKSTVSALECNNCKGKNMLLPSRFVLACVDGHIEDFPYSWWVHRGKKCDNSKLKLEYIGKTGSLESMVISCDKCGLKRSLSGCLSKEAFENFPCKGHQPWLGVNADCICDKHPRVVMRGASNIYYPETVSAVTIPPWSSDVQKIIDKNYGTLKDYFEDEDEEDAFRMIRKWFLRRQIDEILKCSPEEFFEQIKLRFSKNNEADVVTPLEMQYNEYRAFTGRDKDDPYFMTEQVIVPEKYDNQIALIKKVNRLREVQVLKSFRRISAYGEDSGKSAPISKYSYEKWLPAVELLGEGIFLEFQKDALLKWEQSVEERYEKMRKRYNAKRLASRKGSFSPIYVLIHTFSHLLIRELSYQSGYETTSIKEKIYYANEKDGKWMAGLLLYTSSTSSDGSLGGLTRQGSTHRLKQCIDAMLEKAMWCSNDPICIESEAQGVDSMNYAACYACAYIPEISCADNNMLLDRAAIIGSINLKGFFYDET